MNENELLDAEARRDFEQQRADIQRDALNAILAAIEQKYLSRENMYKKILDGSNANFSLSATIERIDLVDAVRENVKTSLIFGRYRRAAWYLTRLATLCEKYIR